MSHPNNDMNSSKEEALNESLATPKSRDPINKSFKRLRFPYAKTETEIKRNYNSYRGANNVLNTSGYLFGSATSRHGMIYVNYIIYPMIYIYI